MPRDATAPSARKTAARGTPASSMRPVILVATRKGAWLFHGDARRKGWPADGPHASSGVRCSRTTSWPSCRHSAGADRSSGD